MRKRKQVKSVQKAQKAVKKSVVGLLLTEGSFLMYSWPLNNIGWNCPGPLIRELVFIFPNKYILQYNITHSWLNAAMEPQILMANCEVIHRFPAVQGVSAPTLPPPLFKSQLHTDFVFHFLQFMNEALLPLPFPFFFPKVELKYPDHRWYFF